MKNKAFRKLTLISIVITLLAVGGGTAQTVRQYATNRQVQTLLNRIETKSGAFKQEIQRNGTQYPVNNNDPQGGIDDLIGDFETATDTFRGRFDARQGMGDEVSELLNKASLINSSMTRNRRSTRAQTQWTSLKTDLTTLARYYRVNWSWSQPVTPVNPTYAATDQQLRNLIHQLESETVLYKQGMENALNDSNVGSRTENSINSSLVQFVEATNRLHQHFDSRQSTVADASEVLNRARYIDQFMASNRMTRAVERQWDALKTDLSTLASYYRVSWNWDQQPPTNPDYPYPNNKGIDARITGTYRLNANRSDNVADVIDRSLVSYTIAERDGIRRNLERRLTSPDMIAIEKVNRTVSIASSNSPEVSFEADGVARTETNQRGRTITTTATANNSGVTINYEGERTNDFYVTFAPSGNNQLSVTRRIYLENRNETVTVSSVYDKVDNTAQWSTVNNGNGNTGNTGGVNDFFIPNGTRLTASLRGAVSTRASQVGDRFAMEVLSPSQYRGAVIEGRVAQTANSGRVSGRANITLEFDTLTMNGRTYRFGGIIDAATAANGDTITVNNEGTIRDTNQTTTTATRVGIGAVLGAIIGAIAGGGQGAAIGAGVGAGAGAGSVLITGRDSIELGQGSTFNITATAPANIGVNRN